MINMRALSQQMWGDDGPSGWREHDIDGPATFGPVVTRSFSNDPLTVIASVEVHEGGQVWLHVSVRKRGNRLPSWGDLVRVKNSFLPDRFAIQVLPPPAQYVNLYEVLHLWSRFDGPTTTTHMESQFGKPGGGSA